MGDISTWDPVDNSNTAAPPDGWPEGMAPSAVNNSARAMMGAMRRWYDTVTAQLGTFLPLGGGTLTGTLSAPQYNIAGILFANNDGTITHIYDGSGGSSLHLQAAQNAYDADLHLFRSNAGANVASIDAAGLIVGVSLSAGHLTSTGNADIAGALTAASLNTSGTISASGLISANAGLNAASLGAATVTAGTVNVSGTCTAANFVGNVSVPANGPVTTGGTVTGGQVASTGDVTAAGSVTGGSMHCAGTLQTDGQSNLQGPVYIGPGGAWARIDSSGSYNVTGSWVSFSDRAVKENVVAYDSRGLAAVLALRPVAFNYRADLFGAEEAQKVRYGLVADEVAQVLPEMVGEAVVGDRHLSTLNTGHLPIVLLNACRELAAQNAALAARITALEGNHV